MKWKDLLLLSYFTDLLFAQKFIPIILSFAAITDKYAQFLSKIEMTILIFGSTMTDESIINYL